VTPWNLFPTGQCELHEGSITHLALVENGSMLVTISSDGIMMLSSVDLLVKGMPIGHRPTLDLPAVHLMRQSDLVALDDRMTDLKNQVSYLAIALLSRASRHAHELSGLAWTHFVMYRQINTKGQSAEPQRTDPTAAWVAMHRWQCTSAVWC